MADEYPSAQVLGIDLIPIQSAWVPLNVKFLVDDAESSWMAKEDFYYLVHGQHITPTIKDFPTFIQRAFNYIPLVSFRQLPLSRANIDLLYGAI